MGAIYYDDPEDRPYGPTNPDYELDGKVGRDMDEEMRVMPASEQAKEPMSDLGKHLFDQMTVINESQRIALTLGRQQMARDVLAWAVQNADAIKGAPVESLLALCNRELK